MNVYCNKLVNNFIQITQLTKLRVEPFELDVSSRVCWVVLFDKLDTGKMHGLDMSNVSSHVVSRRDEPSGIWA